jgi:hypothetical protein
MKKLICAAILSVSTIQANPPLWELDQHFQYYKCLELMGRLDDLYEKVNDEEGRILIRKCFHIIVGEFAPPE